MGSMQKNFVFQQKFRAEVNRLNAKRVQEEHQKFTDDLQATIKTQQEEFQALDDKYVDTVGKLTECENQA